MSKGRSRVKRERAKKKGRKFSEEKTKVFFFFCSVNNNNSNTPSWKFSVWNYLYSGADTWTFFRLLFPIQCGLWFEGGRLLFRTRGTSER